jgi:protein involved in ribonucleotide reduction
MIDSHNGAFEGAWTHIPFYIWALRHAEIVTIHNDQLLNRLKNNVKYSGINFKVLNSRITDFSIFKKTEQTQPYILVVTTFSVDEPVKILLEGILEFCNKYNSSLIFKFTGNYNKDYKLYLEYSNCNKIEFLGYLDEQKYTYYLLNAYGIISLSTRDDVQQFAITEAIGAEIPFISNNNSTNSDLFNDKMILTEITPHSISLNINRFITERELLQSNIVEIKKNLTEKWEKSFIQIKNELGF